MSANSQIRASACKKSAAPHSPSRLTIFIAVCILLAAGSAGCYAFVDSQRSAGIPATFFGMSLINNANWPQGSFGALGKGTTVNWAYSEPQRGQFVWSNLDKWVGTAQAHGLSIFFSNASVPPWAASDQSSCGPTYPGSLVTGCNSMVANISDWDDYITALATRYKGKMIYELWNEPNMKFTGSVADMVTLTTHEFTIIRSIDPDALILAPSGSHSYMDQYFAAGGPSGVDAVTIHCYYPTPEGAVSDITSMKAVMAKHGLSSKPLWDTEGSWGTYSLTADQQVDFVARYYLLHWATGVSRFYWYAWDDPQWGTLWSPITGGSPAATAYQQVYNWLVGATMTSPCNMAPDSTWTCALTRPGGYAALAVWNPSTSKNYTPPGIYQSYRDLSGNIVPVTGAVTIGSNPILLEGTIGP
jgi:Cellulase (glycosyl hydrolase family 5)